MRSKRSRVGFVGVLALAVSAISVPGVANAAKVTEKADGGLVPDATTVGAQTTAGEFTQSFKFKGKNVTKKQTTDVNVIVNLTESAPSAALAASATLIAPKGDNDGLAVPGLGQSVVDVKLDQDSILTQCNPLTTVRSNCNYLQGGNAGGTTGTMTGSINDSLDQEFRGINPKGTWKILWQDLADNDITATIGSVEVELKTAKKFAKE